MPQIFGEGLCGVARNGRATWTDVHERPRDAATTQRTRQKKWPLVRAAKFREETPRKGGGFAIKDRNTALQQYDGMGFYLQAQSRIIRAKNPANTG